MGSFWRFLAKHLLPSIVMAGGALWTGVGIYSQAHEILTAGLKPWQVELSGFLTFVAGVVALLFQFYQANEARWNTQTATPIPVIKESPRPTNPEGAVRLEAAVTATPADLPAPTPATPKRQARRQPKRSYVPESVNVMTLRNLSNDRTGIETARLLQPFNGKWMAVSAVVVDVTRVVFGDYLITVSGLEDKFNIPEFNYTNVFFSTKYGDRIELIQRGECIEFEMRIDVGADGRITFRDAELKN